MKPGIKRRPRATKARRVQRLVQRAAPDRVAEHATGDAGSVASTEGVSRGPLHTADLPIPQSATHCRCGAPIIVDAQRCTRGHQAPRSKGLHYLHGGYAESALESLDALGAIAEKRSALRAHHGGDQSVIEQDLSGDYCRYDVLIETVSANVARMGVLTARGRTRSSVGLLISLMRERQRLGSLLGLRPRLKEADVRDWFTSDDGDDDTSTNTDNRGGHDDEHQHEDTAATDGERHGDNGE